MVGAPFIRVPPVSVTGQLGLEVMLDCLAEGDPPPSISWHSNRAGKLARLGHNYQVLDNGTLHFESIEKQDEADYRCKAKNMYGVAASKEVEVVVEAAAEIKEFPENTHTVQGDKLELQCAATGDPPPIISWLRNGQQVSFVNNNNVGYSNTTSKSIIQRVVKLVINCLNLNMEF